MIMANTLAQIDAWDTLLPRDLILAIGVPSFIMLLFAIAVTIWVRAESANRKAEAAKTESEARNNEKQVNFALQTAQTASSQVGDMQTVLLEMSTKLGEANTQIAVLTEREATREMLWNSKFESLENKLEERGRIIKDRDTTIATIRREKASLEAERNELLSRNDYLESELRTLSEQIAVLEAKLSVYEEASRHAITQPIPPLDPIPFAQDPNAVTPVDPSADNKPDNEDTNEDKIA